MHDFEHPGAPTVEMDDVAPPPATDAFVDDGASEEEELSFLFDNRDNGIDLAKRKFRAERKFRWLSLTAFAIWLDFVNELWRWAWPFEEVSTRAALRGLNLGYTSLSTPQFKQWATFEPLHLTPHFLLWRHLPSGRFVPTSGLLYPYIVLPFWRLHIAHVVIVLAAALACWSLTIAMERWVGPRGAAATVVLYLFSSGFFIASSHTMLPFSVATSLFTTGVALFAWLVQRGQGMTWGRVVAAATAAVALVVAAGLQLSLVFAAIVVTCGVMVAVHRRFVPFLTGVVFVGAAVATLLALIGVNDGHHHALFRGMAMDGGTSLSAIWHNVALFGAALPFGLPIIFLAGAALVTAWRSPARGTLVSPVDRYLITFFVLVWFAGWCTALTETTWLRAPISLQPFSDLEFASIGVVGPLALCAGFTLDRLRSKSYWILMWITTILFVI